MNPPSLDQAIAAVHQLPNLPSATRQVLDCLNDDAIDVHTIARAIARDSGLVVRVLRIANSPYFGLANQVQTIDDAVLVLGISNLRQIVVAAMITEQKFPNLVEDKGVQILFRHSLSVAVCASTIGRNNKMNTNILFLAGILHDIGILAMMSTYPALYTQVQELRNTGGLLTSEAEQRVFRFDHAGIGAALCRHWNLPASIANAVGGHHLSAGPASEAPMDPLAEVVHLADALAHGLNLEADPLAAVPPVSDAAWVRFAGKQDQMTRDIGEIKTLYQELVVLVDSSG